MILFIDSFGAFLGVKDKMFEVSLKKEGKSIKRKIAPGKINSILLSKGTSLSAEAIHLALSYKIDIQFFNPSCPWP